LCNRGGGLASIKESALGEVLMPIMNELYLYDPRTNISTLTTYKELNAFTGNDISNFSKAKRDKRKIRAIGCYLSEGIPSMEQRREWYSNEEYPDEAWKTIKDSDGQFLISTYGRVKRLFKSHEKLLLPFQRKGRGNLFIKAKFKGKYGDHKVGHLVAFHFIREIEPGESVVRKNGIVTDDYVANLKICSKQELGRMTGYKAKSKEVVQLDPATGEIVNEFRSAREAGRQTNFSYQAIMDRCNKVYPYKNEEFVFRWSEEYEEEWLCEIT
jgi:hypothetical protein